MYSVSIVGFGAEHGSTADVFDVPQITQTSSNVFPPRCFVITSAMVDSATDLLDPELLVLPFRQQPQGLRLHVFDGAAPAAECQPACCCGICPDSYVSLVYPVLVQCGPTRWPHLHSVPCCSTPTPRCSATPPSLSTTKLPRCVDQNVSILQMSRVSFSCNRLRQHRRVHRSSRCALHSAAGTSTRHVACGWFSDFTRFLNLLFLEFHLSIFFLVSLVKMSFCF